MLISIIVILLLQHIFVLIFRLVVEREPAPQPPFSEKNPPSQFVSIFCWSHFNVGLIRQFKGPLRATHIHTHTHIRPFKGSLRATQTTSPAERNSNTNTKTKTKTKIQKDNSKALSGQPTSPAQLRVAAIEKSHRGESGFDLSFQIQIISC